ncbi:MAG: hypothetical protein AVDCRST_MAG53-3027 [uncultured Solirubrobacteraceae bacterium]|uniref:Uncharacterized protein n=1 Tax=uncultured Solirubrobacteraceae bacterium TaxID=1162706 RepID=A0A6J4T607_9ACTN|nr:MAG: hypothetical protein AVDCRST_MAG53-3027 [uncultured Solirubrobacteraceae bacterium]
MRLLASALIGSDYQERFQIRQVAGAFLALTTSVEDKYASSARTTLVNLRSGKPRTLAAFHEEAMAWPQPIGTQAVNVIVTPGGRAGASVTERASGNVRIVALGADGGLQQLDIGSPADIPPTELTLMSGRLSWLHAGQPRTSPLP